MSRITTHVLDTARGCPGGSVEVILYRKEGEAWKEAARGETDAGGRILVWASGDVVGSAGVYRLRFETGAYFTRHHLPAFYPFVEVYFEVTGDEHYHIPLLLSPFGYSTYRGS